MERTHKIGASTPYLPAPTLSGDETSARLDAYWHALGVTDASQRAALSEQAVRRRSEMPPLPGYDPVAQAIHAASEVIDDWLAHALEVPKPSTALVAARAALLSGAVPDWPSALFARPGEPCANIAALCTVVAEPTPAPCVGQMPAQRIALFSISSLVSAVFARLKPT